MWTVTATRTLWRRCTRHQPGVVVRDTDGQGHFGPARLVTIRPSGLAVFTSDVDGDGNLDMLSASASTYDSDVSWYRNQGQGQFGPQRVITTDVTQPRAVAAADLDGDGDTDIMAASYGYGGLGDEVAWYENTDGQGTFGEPQVLVTNPVGFRHHRR